MSHMRNAAFPAFQIVLAKGSRLFLRTFFWRWLIKEDCFT